MEEKTVMSKKRASNEGRVYCLDPPPSSSASLCSPLFPPHALPSPRWRSGPCALFLGTELLCTENHFLFIIGDVNGDGEFPKVGLVGSRFATMEVEGEEEMRAEEA